MWRKLCVGPPSHVEHASCEKGVGSGVCMRFHMVLDESTPGPSLYRFPHTSSCPCAEHRSASSAWVVSASSPSLVHQKLSVHMSCSCILPLLYVESGLTSCGHVPLFAPILYFATPTCLRHVIPAQHNRLWYTFRAPQECDQYSTCVSIQALIPATLAKLNYDLGAWNMLEFAL